MLKELLADCKRYRSDKKTNNVPVTLVESGNKSASDELITRQVRTEELRVGDVV